MQLLAFRLFHDPTRRIAAQKIPGKQKAEAERGSELGKVERQSPYHLLIPSKRRRRRRGGGDDEEEAGADEGDSNVDDAEEK